MSFPNLSIWPKTHPFFPQFCTFFAPLKLKDVRAYIAWSWKTTLITWFFYNGDDIQLQIQVHPPPNFDRKWGLKKPGVKERPGTKDRGWKNWFWGKDRGLKKWILGQCPGQYEALELKFCKIWGFGTEIFVNLCSRTAKLVKNCGFCWKGNMLKGGLRELLRELEKGVLRAAHPRTTFQGEYVHPGLYDIQLQIQLPSPPDFDRLLYILAYIWTVPKIQTPSKGPTLHYLELLRPTLFSKSLCRPTSLHVGLYLNGKLVIRWAKSKTSVFATDGIWVTFSVVLNFLLLGWTPWMGFQNERLMC